MRTDVSKFQMIVDDFEEDPDPRDRVAVAFVTDKRKIRYLAVPFATMFQDLAHPLWELDELRAMRREHLQMLCRFIGAPISGNLDKIITRLLAVHQVHKKLKPFPLGEHGRATATFTRDEIRWMCREAGLPRSLDKRTMCFFLLAWRATTQQSGQQYLDAIKSGPRPTPFPPAPRKRIGPLIARVFRRREHLRRKRCHA